MSPPPKQAASRRLLERASSTSRTAFVIDDARHNEVVNRLKAIVGKNAGVTPRARA